MGFPKGVDVCSSMEEFDRYEKSTYLLLTRDKKYIEKTTGCLYPCTYHEYKVLVEKCNVLLLPYATVNIETLSMQ